MKTFINLKVKESLNMFWKKKKKKVFELQLVRRKCMEVILVSFQGMIITYCYEYY